VKHKYAAALIAIALALLLALPLGLFWWLHSRPTPVRVTFQHAINGPGNARLGVIELVNNLNERVTVMGGWYVPLRRTDLSLSKDTPLAPLNGNAAELPARSTNIRQLPIPTNGGPYRLVFQCMPESKDPARIAGTRRFRLLSLISPWLSQSQVTQVRWFGGFFAASESIGGGQAK
jgi:hypothetical protein